ncbi:MAG: circadian clock protein KaiB [Proteobacteria bacterium]|nr:circadian clock protein KaiB [Pseudomonadota bacterium]
MNVAAVADPTSYRLRLIVAGSTQRSRKAIETLRNVCNTRLDGQVDLEVIDIYQLPEMAREYQVIAAPTLLKLLPLPVRRIIGDLSNSEKLLIMLDLAPATPP